MIGKIIEIKANQEDTQNIKGQNLKFPVVMYSGNFTFWT